jgi:archaellum biogenesis protein FlaJ (TadC family)
MQYETKAILRRVGKAIFVSAFMSYALAILVLIASPPFWNGNLAMSYLDMITLVLFCLLCVPVYFYYVRKDFKSRTLGR